MIPVAPGDGADAWNSDLADEEKNKKIFKLPLEKAKINDILRIRCVLSAAKDAW